MGGGFEIVLSCDLVVAGENAVFGLPEVKRGLVASGGGLLRLQHRTPLNLATEWTLTGAPLAPPPPDAADRTRGGRFGRG